MFSSNLKAALVTVVAGSFSFAKGKEKKSLKKEKPVQSCCCQVKKNMGLILH